MYSQYGEEEHILASLAGCTARRFLDLGAFHPTIFSNTRALVEAGWSGVFVDVSPSAIRTLVEEYGRKTDRFRVVQCAVSPKNEDRGRLIEIQATMDAVTTSDKATFDKWKGTVDFYGSFLAPCVPVLDLVREFQGSGFDFINIDVEGVSVDVLREILGSVFRPPRCICVEYDDARDVAVSVARAAGYRVAHENGTNLVFSLR